MAKNKQEVAVAAVADVNPQDLSVEDALRQELEAAKAETAFVKEKLDEARAEKAEMQRELDALREKTNAPAPKSDSREKLFVRTASGREFWRAGVLFNESWQEIRRADVGDDAWQRIVNEPALQCQEAV